jgi:hypothetical protein
MLASGICERGVKRELEPVCPLLRRPSPNAVQDELAMLKAHETT